MQTALSINAKPFDDLSNRTSNLKPLMKNFEITFETQKLYLFLSYGYINHLELRLCLEAEMNEKDYKLIHQIDDEGTFTNGSLKAWELELTRDHKISFDTGYKMLYKPVWVPTANKMGIVVEESKEFVSIKFAPGKPWVKIGIEHVVRPTEYWKKF